MKRLLGLFACAPLLASAATTVNLANLPTASGCSTSDRVVAVTNSTRSALVPISQLLSLSYSGLPGYLNQWRSIPTNGVSLPTLEVTGTLTEGSNTIASGSSTINGVTFANGTITAPNSLPIPYTYKTSFTTNFTCTTNIQVYFCNGTNQTVTLPDASKVTGFVYRFPVTNGLARVILTNATGAQTIRDGTSLSFLQIGIGSPAFISDGNAWWPASKIRTILPNAQFSCTTNIPLTSANVAYPITFNSIDFNNSQGIALAAGTNGLNSKMWITNSGQYELDPSIVFNPASGAAHTIRYWFRSSNTNIPNSCTPVRVSGSDIIVVTVPFIVNVTAPTAFEIWAQSEGAGDAVQAQSASGNYPAGPAVICPVKRISEPYP